MKRINVAFLTVFFILSMIMILAMPVMADGLNTITGTVYDENGHGIPMAKVTLYYTKWGVTDYKPAGQVYMQGNPQNTSDGGQTPVGQYTFTDLPSDVYMLTAEKDGIAISQFVNVKDETTIQNLAIRGYAENEATPNHTPTTRMTGPTYTRLVDGGSQDDLGAMVLEVISLALMVIVGIQFIFGVVAILLHIGRKG